VRLQPLGHLSTDAIYIRKCIRKIVVGFAQAAANKLCRASNESVYFGCLVLVYSAFATRA